MASAQGRISDRNSIGWLAYTGTFRLTEKVGIHTEYQWRRASLLTNWQQGLLRVGVNYNFTPQVQLRVGYAWAETFAYGHIPLNSFGKTYTEHRAFQTVTLTNRVPLLDITHRLMLEQRWVGRYSQSNLTNEDSYLYTNRARYMLRLQVPLNKPGKSFAPYIAVYDELFIAFGKNVGENIFDQNRVGLLLGAPISKSVRVEGGYLNQIVQLGREVNGQNVFQKNNGFIVTGIFNFNLQKSKTAK